MRGRAGQAGAVPQSPYLHMYTPPPRPTFMYARSTVWYTLNLLFLSSLMRTSRILAGLLSGTEDWLRMPSLLREDLPRMLTLPGGCWWRCTDARMLVKRSPELEVMSMGRKP